MKKQTSLSLIATILLIAFMQNLYGQAVPPEQNWPTFNEETPPPVTNYPYLTNLSANGITANSPYNYVRTWIPDQPTTTITGTLYHRQVTDYYDGLGRPLQTVQQKGHADGFDIVQHHVYDSAGRESYQYLPYATNEGSMVIQPGKFHFNAKNDVTNFFNVNSGEEPYSKTEYDNSPLNRVTTQLAPGHSWVGQNRGVTYEYLSDETNEDVRIWKIGDNATDVPVTIAAYAGGQLYVTRTTDEDEKYSLEYRDKLGRLILKKVYDIDKHSMAHKDYACTYYVYDGLNRLRYVIPPLAVQSIDGTWNFTYVQDLCYSYFYDERGRLIEKKSPGKETEYFVYDKRDRPVFYQDGNLRSQGKWQFTIYDALDRPVVAGIMLASTSTQASLKSGINNTATYAAPSIWHYVKDYTLWHNYPTSITTGSGASQINSYTYYDDYSNTPSGLEFDNTQFPTVTQSYLVPSVKSNSTRGLVTGTKELVLESPNNPWILSQNYYDEKGRLIQNISTNIEGGIDITSYVYYFQGMLWKTITRHQNPHAKKIPGASDLMSSITLENTYDRNISTGGGNDLVWAHHQKINDGLNYELAYYDYNQNGQIRNKQFTVTNVTNNYNIRGWLTGINATYFGGQNPSNTTNYFNEALSYDHGFTSKLYNGNIAGIIWNGYHSNTFVEYPSNAYGYNYDMLNRLTHAEYQYRSGASYLWNKSIKDYTVSNITYDRNGNLQSMSQRNPGNGTPIDMDKLKYTYAPYSNKLIKVKDSVLTTATVGLPDFKDGADLGIEYNYDENGNIETDANKKITSISYNYLNKPSQITVADQGTIYYFYDATGNRLRKIVTPITGDIDTFDYIGNFVYKNNVLQYILNDEGRCRPVYSPEFNATRFVYDYFIKDHLGNVRTTVSAEPITAQYLARTELASANIEQLFFDNIPAVRDDKPGSTSPDDHKAAHLIAEDSTKRIGPAIMLKVMPGDQINVSVDGYYETNPHSNTTLKTSDVVSSLITALAGGVNFAGVPVESLPANIRTIQNILGNGGLPMAIDNLPIINADSAGPKAYLNVLLFDDNFQLVPGQSGRFQIPTGGNSWGPVVPTGGVFGSIVNIAGFLITYVDNESIGNDVWFDNLNISHYSGGVLEDNFYYPFELTISDDAQPANTDQPYKYNTKELERHFGLETYEYGARQYDPQIGRFNGIDASADKYYPISPFAYVADRPTVAVDPDGRRIYFIGGAGNDPVSQGWNYINRFNSIWTNAGLSDFTRVNASHGKFGDMMFVSNYRNSEFVQPFGPYSPQFTMSFAQDDKMLKRAVNGIVADMSKRQLKEGEQLNMAGYSYGAVLQEYATIDLVKKGYKVDNLILVASPTSDNSETMKTLQQYKDDGKIGNIIRYDIPGDRLSNPKNGIEFTQGIKDGALQGDDAHHFDLARPGEETDKNIDDLSKKLLEDGVK